MAPEDPEELARRLVHLHDENPAFRAIAASAAPRIHAMLTADQARRLVGFAVTLMVVGAASALLATGLARVLGIVGTLTGSLFLFEAWRLERRARRAFRPR